MTNVIITKHTKGNVGIIRLSNPPVNALNVSLRHGLLEAVKTFANDSKIQILVVLGSGKMFSAGADINEFQGPMANPSLPYVCEYLEKIKKPIIAAVHGSALGGGCELAMSCHFRIGLESAKIGVPEIQLGLIPGATGTQRLPRLTGALKAVDMMVTGNPITGSDALLAGLFDRVITVEEKLESEAIKFANEIISSNIPISRTADRNVCIKGVKKDKNGKFFFEKLNEEKEIKTHLKIPLDAIKRTMIAAIEMPFNHGLEIEQKAFIKCMSSTVSRSLIHLFLSQRKTSSIPEIVKAKLCRIKKIGIVGGGTMGSGITVAALNAGFSVIMVERDLAGIQKGIKNVTDSLERDQKKGRISGEQKSKILSRYKSSLEYNDLSEVDLVIEAIFEDLEIKKALFANLDKIVRKGAILATNTSYLDVDAIASVTSRPDDVIGLHFFSPANIMKLLEIVVPKAAKNDVVATAFNLAKQLKKIPVRSANCDGFIGNRMLDAYSTVASFMVEDGASPYDIDRVLKEFGFPMGIHEVFDLAGNDIILATRKRQKQARYNEIRSVQIIDRICERGWFGQKTGRGFYKYEKNSKKCFPDPEVLSIIDDERKQKGIFVQQFSDNEILRRYMASMVNEGCKILEEKIAMRPSDIDIVKVFGYGFPKFRGGPMHYADQVGLNNILTDINEFAVGEKKSTYFWQASELLKDLVKKGANLSSLNL